MRETIQLFMWGFQQHFRRWLENNVERALADLGVATDVSCYLIGVLQPGGDRYPLCIEPEDGSLGTDHFAGIAERAEALFDEDPESSMWHSDASHHERMQRWAHQRATASAIREVIEAVLLDETCFVGFPTLVEQHHVYPVICLPTAFVDSLPALKRTSGPDPRRRIDQSIVHAAIDAILGQASQELHYPDAGADMGLGGTADETLRVAVRRLVRAAVLLSGKGSTMTLLMRFIGSARCATSSGSASDDYCSSALMSRRSKWTSSSRNQSD